MKHINEETAIALKMRANLIETGDIHFSRHDVINKITVLKDTDIGCRALREVYMKMLLCDASLTPSQRKLVQCLREHACQIENGPRVEVES